MNARATFKRVLQYNMIIGDLILHCCALFVCYGQFFFLNNWSKLFNLFTKSTFANKVKGSFCF